jgi:two-component sensor histidine kinase
VLPLIGDGKPDGLLVLCRDTTELRSRERQLVTKDATIREIHHRVKNNLQTVAALLRLQARRISSPEAKGALNDAMKRVAAIAVVHEILSQDFDSTVFFDDVADRLLRMVGDVAATGGKVRMVRQGSFGSVPADVATSLSLVLTELCQNAVEHGLKDSSGEVFVRPKQADGKLVVEVENHGEPLPPDFTIAGSNSLGLSIVSTLVADLKGEFSLESDAERTVATVRVPLS